MIIHFSSLGALLGLPLKYSSDSLNPLFSVLRGRQTRKQESQLNKTGQICKCRADDIPLGLLFFQDPGPELNTVR